MNSTPRKVRYETVVVTVALLAGLVLRIGSLDRVAIDHFDEGVYSSNLWFAETPNGQYPMRHLYAPPLLPAAIEWCQVFLGPTTLASILPSLLAGCLTIFLVWWLLHHWYGTDAAIVGVWLAALSDFHAVYSRMALTDVMLGFFVLSAVGLSIEAILRGGFVRVTLAGLATGLAWWTKYNGWLPLAIAGSGTAAWLFFYRPKSVPVATAGMRWLLIACVAGAVWSPVWFGLQDKGGYATVAANHRGYLNPAGEWTSALAQQVTNHRVLEGWLTWSSVLLAIASAGPILALLDVRFTWKQIPQGGRDSAIFSLTCGLIVLALAVTLIGVSATLFIVAVGGLAGCLIWPLSIPGDEVREEVVEATSRNTLVLSGDRSSLANWMIAAWLIGLLVATPAYRPYPRLTLPWLIAVWLGAAVAFAWWFRAIRNVARKSSTRGVSLVWSFAVAFFGLSLLANLNVSNSYFLIRPRHPRTGLAEVVQKIGNEFGDRRFITFTYGEPALMHLLNSAGHAAVPTASLNTIPGPQPGTEILVVVGDHARRSAEFESQWLKNSHRFESLLVSRFQPSDVVALNDPDAAAKLVEYLAAVPGFRRPGDESPPETEIEVFRVVAER